MAERYQEAEDIFNEWEEDDRQREAEAKALGITMAELDAKEASLRPFKKKRARPARTRRTTSTAGQPA